MPAIIFANNLGVGPRGFMLISVLLKGSVLIDIWLAKKFLLATARKLLAQKKTISNK
jgi:hypothetical protein